MTEDRAPDLVLDHFRGLQDRICEAFEAVEPRARFDRRVLEGERGGASYPRVLEGEVLEKAAVHLSHAVGPQLPPTATERRPELAGRPFEAVSLSLITHPRNPYAPTSHMNLRFFHVDLPEEARGETVNWWFGGGFDLTPIYGFEEDARHWHRSARDACARHGATLHARFKQWCDRYFLLPHRDEARGVGGLFFDDLVALEEGGDADFDAVFAFVRDVGDHYLRGYLPILERRRGQDYGPREVDFQSYRRGRYAEFNLLYDRGTKYGLQARGRTESILASMPPRAIWRYDWKPEPGSPEARLTTDFLPARDWLDDEA